MESVGKPNRQSPDKFRLKAFEPYEHAIQCSFIQWVRYQERSHHALRLSYSVPNGGSRNIATAARLKAEGTRRGVPDWHLPVAGSGFIGLWIEFKRFSGTLSVVQREYIALLRDAGHQVEVCKSPDEAIAVVQKYLSNQEGINAK